MVLCGLLGPYNRDSILGLTSCQVPGGFHGRYYLYSQPASEKEQDGHGVRGCPVSPNYWVGVKDFIEELPDSGYIRNSMVSGVW